MKLERALATKGIDWLADQGAKVKYRMVQISGFLSLDQEFDLVDDLTSPSRFTLDWEPLVPADYSHSVRVHDCHRIIERKCSDRISHIVSDAG